MISEARRLGFSIGLKSEHSIDVYHQYEYFAPPRYLSSDPSKLHILKNLEGQDLPKGSLRFLYDRKRRGHPLTRTQAQRLYPLTYAYGNAYEGLQASSRPKPTDSSTSSSNTISAGTKSLPSGTPITMFPMLEKAGRSVAMGDGHPDALVPPAMSRAPSMNTALLMPSSTSN